MHAAVACWVIQFSLFSITTRAQCWAKQANDREKPVSARYSVLHDTTQPRCRLKVLLTHVFKIQIVPRNLTSYRVTSCLPAHYTNSR